MLQARKLLVLLLVTVTVLTSFVACDNTAPDPAPGSDTQGEESGSSSESSVESTEENTDPIGNGILAGVTFDGTVIYVLKGSSMELDEYVEELTEGSSLIDQAVYNRCDYAENRLNVRTQWTPVGTDIVDVADRHNSNGGTYDIIANKSSYSAALMTRGVLSNLTQYPYMDFESEGWAFSLLSDVKVGNKLYFATGDISTNLIFMTSVIFFNKDLVKDLGINEKIQSRWEKNDLYELVSSGAWTLDKMITLSENVYLDKNNSGAKDYGDRFGFNTYSNLLENFYYGGGYTTITTGDDGFTVSEDFLNPQIVGALLETVNDFLHDSNDGVIESGTKNANYDEARWNFSAGNVLFCMAPASHAYNTHSNTDKLEYGVLPIPKHSEQQDRYACTQSFPYCMYSITSQGKHPVEASAFLQALAEESYKVTRPALFDKMMKGRYAESPEDAQMWEYAVDANVFDVGRVFQELFEDTNEGYLTVNLFRNRVKDDNENWSAVLSTYMLPLLQKASALAGVIMALPD